jgi:protein-tyrosine-phosphatase
MKVLFVCVENAGRSQMAEAFAKRYGLFADSAGTHPSGRVDDAVVHVMKERGIDLSQARPSLLTAKMIDEADLVVTMGCSVEEVCPAPIVAKMQKKVLDWNLEDPKNKPVETVRHIRDDIENRVRELTHNQEASKEKSTRKENQ